MKALITSATFVVTMGLLNPLGLSVKAQGNQDPPKLLPQIPTLPVSGTDQVPVRDIATLVRQIPAGTPPSLEWLGNQAATPRYIAVGGSLTSGNRDGGLFLEAQQTAYPNLLAHQMGLSDFQTPYFSVAEGNGSGFKKLISSSGFPKFTLVTNNLAVAGKEPPAFTPYSGRADNLGFPMLGVHSSHANETWRFDDRIAPGTPYEPAFRPYFRRILPDDDKKWSTSYISYVLQQKADFMTIELGLDDAIWFATAGGYRVNGVMTQLAMGEGSSIIALLNAMGNRKIKGAIATVPDVLAFPYFQFYPVSAVRKRLNGQKLYAVAGDRYDLEAKDEYVAEVSDSDILLPSADVAALASGSNNGKGLSVKKPLSSHDVLSVHEMTDLQHVDELNSLIRFQAQKANVALVDLQSLYRQIIAGGYVTDDGLAIDPSFPDGNFFSSDGLQPTALGQAVITNEWIKAINKFYRTDIPLIPAKLFAQSFGK